MNRRLVVIDVAACAGIHVGTAYLAHRLPESLYRADRWWWRCRRFERAGHSYETGVAIRSWKHLLPDGGPLLPGGFSKSRLASRDRAYLNQFALETCRGELAHWLALVGGVAAAASNPPLAAAGLGLYALATNGPCIAVQRYNRARLMRLLTRAPGAADVPSRPLLTQEATGKGAY